MASRLTELQGRAKEKLHGLGQRLNIRREGDMLAQREIPGDPLKGHIEDFTELEALTKDIEACQLSLLEVCKRLEAAPAPLLQRWRSDCSSCGDPYAQQGVEVLARVSALGSEGIRRASTARRHIEELASRGSQTARERHSALRQAMAFRVEAWNCKAKCDEEYRELNRPAKSSRFGGFSLDEKQARVRAKSQADEAWKEADREVRAQLHDVLDTRPYTTSNALGEFCGFYATLFEDAELWAANCRHLQAELLRVPPALSSSSHKTTLLPVVAADEADLSEVAELKTCTLEAIVAEADSGALAEALADAEFLDDSLATALETKGPTPTSFRVESALSKGDVLVTRLSEKASSASSEADLALGVSSVVCVVEDETLIEETTDGHATEETKVPFADGEKISVWSSTQQAWIDGIVDSYFAEAGIDASYVVNAGMVKVSHAFGTKYVKPEDVEKTLRRHSGVCI